MLELTFTVEAEPVPAPRPRVTKRGVYYSKRYTDWLDHVRVAADDLREYSIRFPVGVTMRFRTTRQKRMDIDNLAKGVLDALTGIIWENDNVVEYLAAYKDIPRDRRKPGVTVTIHSIRDAERSLT